MINSSYHISGCDCQTMSYYISMNHWMNSKSISFHLFCRFDHILDYSLSFYSFIEWLLSTKVNINLKSKMLRKLIIILCQLFKNVCICFTQTDKTIEKYAIGEEVIEDFIQMINISRLFDDDNRILKKISELEFRICSLFALWALRTFWTIRALTALNAIWAWLTLRTHRKLRILRTLVGIDNLPIITMKVV